MKKYYRLFGIVVLVIILRRIDFSKVIEVFSQLNFMLFILISLLILPGLFLKSLRWRYLLYMQGIDYSMKDSFLSYLGGCYAGIITPGRIGEAIKVVYLKKEKNVAYSKGLASIFADRFFDLYLLSVIGLIGLYRFLHTPNNMILVIIACVLILFPLIFLFRGQFLLEHFARGVYRSMAAGLDKKFLEGKFKKFLSSIKTMVNGRIYFPFFLTITVYLLYFSQCYLLAKIAGINISYETVMFFTAISVLVSILPITILGIGTREVSLVYLFSLIGLSSEKAVAYSFLLFFSFYVFSSILAFIGWFSKSRGISAGNG